MSTSMSAAQAAQQSNRGPGGQYSFGTHAEPEAVALTEPAEPEIMTLEEFEEANEERREEMLKALESFMPEKTDLYFIDYDDRLSSTQINLVLAGDDNGAYEEFMQNVEGYGRDRAGEDAKTALEEAESKGLTDITWDDLDSEDQERFVLLLEERDQSDPISDLTRNTPSQMMRTRLDSPSLDPTLGEAWSGHALYSKLENPENRALLERRYEIVGKTLSKYGIDITTEQNQSALKELVDEGPYDWHEGVDIDVIFVADVQDAAASYEGEATLKFADPHVVLIDRMNGSGYDAQFGGAITKTIPASEDLKDPAERVYLDRGGVSGYGWDEVCGLVKSAYETEIDRSVQMPEEA